MPEYALPIPGRPSAWREPKYAQHSPLAPEVAQRFSPLLAHDFSKVRVWSDGGAARAADAKASDAFTVGSDVTFARGRYRPGTQRGDALLAHELAHVVQQARGGASRGAADVEIEAHRAASAILKATTSPCVALLSGWPTSRRTLPRCR